MLLVCLLTAFSVTNSRAGDRGVRPALGHQRRAPRVLAGVSRSSGSSCAAPGQQRGHHLGVEHGAAVRHPPHGVDERGDVGDPVLEQIADGALAALEQLAGVELLDVLRQHQDREARPHPARLDRRPQPLVGEGRRHPDVDDGDLGGLVAQRARRSDGRCRRRPRPRSRAPRGAGSGRPGGGRGLPRGQHARHLHDDDGRAALGLDTDIVPSNAASRRITPSIPVPASRARAAAAVVADLDVEHAVAVADVTQARLGAGVLDDVRQALRHREVHGRLDRRRRPAGHLDGDA